MTCKCYQKRSTQEWNSQALTLAVDFLVNPAMLEEIILMPSPKGTVLT